MSFIFIYITNPDMARAKKLTNHLLKKRLIACANVFPIKSIYWWKGEVEESDEVVLIAKTRKQLWQKLKTEVKKLHPYDTPCITKLDAEANKEFEEWVHKETKG
jgi:periplasmic divalent cation tolerance protein